MYHNKSFLIGVGCVLVFVLAAVVLLLTTTSPVSGQTETNGTNIYCMHTFIHDFDTLENIRKQLDWAKAIVGDNGYVVELFYPITKDTTGPKQSWIDFVNEAYARNLDPIIRFQGTRTGDTWDKPEPDSPRPGAGYTQIADAWKRVVEGLPRVDGRTLWIQVWNEPNLANEWGGQANAEEYANFFVAVSDAIRSIGDPRIKILNGPLAPTLGGTGSIETLQFIRDAIDANPNFKTAFDAWATHPFPANQPPENNTHDGTTTNEFYGDVYTIDRYVKELETLAEKGVDISNLKVIGTEAGSYELGRNDFEAYPPIDEENRADYIRRAFEEYWSSWPEVLAMCPYQLSDPSGSWWRYDWVYPDSGTTVNGHPTKMHLQYASVNRGTGIFRGIVTDESGNPIEDATIVTDTGGFEAATISDGTYIMIADPGTYDLTASKDGYESVTVTGQSVTEDGITEVNFVLTKAQAPADIVNPGFETGDLTGWTTWGAVDGVQTGPWFAGIEPYEGTYFLGTATNGGEKDGGVYQTIAADVGRDQKVTVWIQTYKEGFGLPTNCANRLGVDPYGGTDPTSSNVVWTAWTASEGSWTELSLTVTAQAPQITIFLEHRQDSANTWNVNAFDYVTRTQL